MNSNFRFSVWSLIQEDKFEEACKKADEDYLITKSSLLLANKTTALIILKKYEESLKLSLEMIDISKGNSDYEFLRAGVSYWLLEKYDEAIKIWKDGLNRQYTDSLGGVDVPAILYYASIFLKDEKLEKEALNILNKKMRNKKTWVCT